ncbi:MAG: flavodoxin family protein, partial [Candidatus Omnitrophota bacterium]
MKILVVSSSPRKEKSQTFLLAKEVLKGCKDEAEAPKSEIIHLCDYRIEFCQHYEECHRKILNCPIEDDADMILKKMLEADGIILASPNYINQVTASMKALFDRSSHFIHCRRLLGKYVAGAVSSGSGQDEDVLDYVRYYAHTCAAQYSGGVSCRAPVSGEKIEEARRLGKKLTSDIKERKKYSDQIKIIE